MTGQERASSKTFHDIVSLFPFISIFSSKSLHTDRFYVKGMSRRKSHGQHVPSSSSLSLSSRLKDQTKEKK
jgi:hypothetical protein